jgi:Asp-tRNA(Asn)/Glu-tRNA(Gln) amidotransferase A subunit family amidase
MPVSGPSSAKPDANMTGLPALTVPVGYDHAGLPIGGQFVGPPWTEARLLDIARLTQGRVPMRRAPGAIDLLSN